jgi:hypothetical protein
VGKGFSSIGSKLIGGGGGGGSLAGKLTGKSIAEKQWLKANSVGGVSPSQDKLDWDSYKSENSQGLEFEPWKRWQESLNSSTPFTPPTYELQQFEQLPTTPQAVPQNVQASAPQAQVINRYLEQVMKNVGGEGSGQTEVGKALRAKSSGGEK